MISLIKARPTALLGSACVALAALFSATPGVALAHYTVPNYQQKCNHAYCFYNYDNEGITYPQAGTATNADNPITTVFEQNATAVMVHSLFGELGGWGSPGSQDAEVFGSFYDYSKGLKTQPCSPSNPNLWDTHARLYPDSTDGGGDLYDPYWGYFVLADTHQDEECTGQFGYQEQAEGYLRQQMGQNKVSCFAVGYLTKGQPCVNGVQNDATNFYNSLQWPNDGGYGNLGSCGTNNGYFPTNDSPAYSHCLENDGAATVINVQYYSGT